MARRKSCKYGKLKHPRAGRRCRLVPRRRKKGLTKADVKKYHAIVASMGRRSRR